ncbi:MAG: hypothetical protein ACK4GL_07610 [Flavobacteriales bacterium]
MKNKVISSFCFSVILLASSKICFCQKKLFKNTDYFIISNNHVGGSFLVFFQENTNLHALSLLSRNNHKLIFEDKVFSVLDNRVIEINKIELLIPTHNVDEFTFANNVSFINNQYIFYHLDDEIHYFIKKNDVSGIYNLQTKKKIVEYQSIQFSLINTFYSISHNFEGEEDGSFPKPNLTIKEFYNDSLVWNFSINYIEGDEYSSFVKKNIDVYHDEIALLSLSKPEFYILCKKSMLLDTITFVFKDSVGNVINEYVKPSYMDVLKCNSRNDGYLEILNGRYRNEKIFFLSNSLVLVSYIVPGYMKKFRNIALFKKNELDKWELIHEFFQVNQKGDNSEEICRSNFSLNLTNSLNPVFVDCKGYYMNPFFSFSGNCITKNKALKRYIIGKGFNQTLISKFELSTNAEFNR